MPRAERSIDIAVSPEHVFDVVEDFARYPEYFPEMRSARVLRKDEHGQDVEFELEIALPLGIKKRLRYSLAFREQRPHRVDWTLIRGEIMKGNVGSWRFESTSSGGTRATYAIELSFGPLVPRAVTDFLAEQSLPTLLQQVKRRAETLAR